MSLTRTSSLRIDLQNCCWRQAPPASHFVCVPRSHADDPICGYHGSSPVELVGIRLCEIRQETAPAVSESTVLSRDVFVEELIQALHAAGETRTIRYEAEIFSVLIGDNRQFPDVVVRLDEEFRHCEKLPPDRRANEIHRFAEICRQPKIPDDYQEAQAHLRLSLRHISFVQLHAELAATWPSSMAPTSPVYAKVTDELILCVGLIKGPVARILTGEQAARWNVSADQLVQNAARNHFKSEFRLRQTGSVYRSPGGDTDLAAVLVSGHLLSKLPLRGSPVILVPASQLAVKRSKA